MNHDLVIKNARVVTPEAVVDCDMVVQGGRIAASGHDLRTSDIIDAAGLIAMPGGIDSHIHISQPYGPGIDLADISASTTRAGAFGGKTTVVPFCRPEEGQSPIDSVHSYLPKADGNCLTEISCDLIVKSVDFVTLGKDMPALIAQGMTSLRICMTYQGMPPSDSEMLQLMDAACGYDALTRFHAENEDAMEFLQDKAKRVENIQPVFRARTRPVATKREATHRALTLVEVAEVPVIIVHVSNGSALDEIRRAKARGVRMVVEPCPKYLTWTADDLDRAGVEGTKRVCAPSPLDLQSQAMSWVATGQDHFDMILSDHCPFPVADTAGSDAPGSRKSSRNSANDILGIGTRLLNLFSEAVHKRRMSLRKFAALTATNHVRIYDMTTKGTLAVVKDANILLWDPTLARAIKQDKLHHGSDYTPWEGFEVTGWPLRTLPRVQTIMLNGEPTATMSGCHIARSTTGVMA